MRNCGFRNAGVIVDLTVTYNMTLVAKDSKYKLILDPIEWTDNYVYPDLNEDMEKSSSKKDF